MVVTARYEPLRQVVAFLLKSEYLPKAHLSADARLRCLNDCF